MPKRTDANQTAIVSAFRKCGASVAITSALGKGFPDLVVGYRRRNFLVEIKDGSKPPSAQKLTPDETKWHDAWRGQITIIRSVDDVLTLLNEKEN
jgi:hypothetical protein